MTREELEMRKLVRESDVIDRTDGTELAKAFNYLWEKYVEQEPKTGHWEQYGNSWEDKFKCSECGKEQPKIICCERIIGHWSDYCPDCGARMEDKE